MTRLKTILSSGIRRLALGALLGVFAVSCTLLEETGIGSAPRIDGEQGIVDLRVSLSLPRNVSALGKSASADTTFSLDSLTIILSANGAATQTHTFAVTGRADLGNIVVSPKTFVLSSLRLWKAKFISIDTTANPNRRDTVHMDSVSFNVRAAETTFVAKTVNPVWSILRVRLRSTQADSLVNNVLFVRLRVNGVVRDSAMIGGSSSNLNWLQAMSGSTVHAAGDSGKILRSTNNGTSWTQTRLPDSRNLVAGYFPTESRGYVMSPNGRLRWTDDGGLTWPVNQDNDNQPATPDSMRALHFVGSNGFMVGKGGAIYKFSGAPTTRHQLVSNTSQALNGVHFVNDDVGFVVGENETILKTTNGSAAAGSPPPNGIVWSPVAGGWFPQTSATTNSIRAVHFVSATDGWAFGTSGYAYKTSNGGATWITRSMPNTMNTTAASFVNATFGYVVGENGFIRRVLTNENDWQLMSNSVNTINGRHLYDVKMVNTDTGLAVGANGALLTTFNGSAAPNQVLWTSLRGWFPAQSGLPNWRTAYGVAFAPNSDTGWTVMDNGEIFRTTNRGLGWTQQSTSGSNYDLRDVVAHTPLHALVVGYQGTIRRTVDGGANWTIIQHNSGPNIQAVAFTSQKIGWHVGQGNVLRSTNDSGKTWTDRAATGTFYGVAVGASRVFVAGASGVVLRSADKLDNTSFTAVGNSGLTSFQLNAVEVVGSDTAWVVGNGGVIFRSLNANVGTPGSVTWTRQANGLTNQNLTRVHFANHLVGYISGANGTVLKTTDGGANWAILSHGITTSNLYSLHLLDSDIVYTGGENGTLIKTADGGAPDTTTYRGLETVTSKRFFAVGSAGKIMRTTNSGEKWFPLNSGLATDLNAITFRTASIGYAAGKSGRIIRTTDGGDSWSMPLTTPNSLEIISMKFVSADTGFAVGKTGLILKTTNGGNSWYEQEAPSNANLNGLHVFTRDMIFAAGDNGTILKAVNEGDNWTGGGVKRSLKAVHFPTTNIGYVVGAEGFILKTTNGGDFWKPQSSPTSATLYSVHFTNVDTGYAVGDGVILKTVNGGTNWSSQVGATGVALRRVHARNGSRAFAIGGTQTMLSTANGGLTPWTGSFAGIPGAKVFDQLLTYKYFKPNVSHTVILEAMDRMELPLRGFQATRSVTIGAGVDSVMVSPMARCGYTNTCTP